MDLATEKSIQYAERIAYSSKEVLRFTYDQAVKYKDWPGVYVECGVAAGAQIIAMAAGAPNKKIYAFDSFEGIPLASNKDNQAPGLHYFTKAEQMALPNPGKQALVSSGATVVSLNDFITHLDAALSFRDDVNFRKNIIPIMGWFEETVKEFSTYRNIDISILRLDGDLYNSTYVCLKYMYPKVMKGGIIIVDDWALPGCRQAVFDYFFDERGKTEPPLNMKYIKDENSTVAWWTK